MIQQNGDLYIIETRHFFAIQRQDLITAAQADGLCQRIGYNAIRQAVG